MRILIDNQYETLYGGEFKEYVKTNIINRINTKSNTIDYPKSFEDISKMIIMHDYDLVIVTGYDAKILGLIDDKKYDTKVACVIYDMNAEQVLSEIDDNGFLSDIVAFKSRLIFLSNFILCYNNVVRSQILELYSSYTKVVDVVSKIVDIDFIYNIEDHQHSSKRIINNKYVLIKESINGLTFLSSDFDNLITNIINNKNNIPLNFLFVIICNKFPEKIWHTIKNNGLQNNFKIFDNVDHETLNNLYKQSIASIFISPIDNNLTNLCDAIFNDCLCMINYKNKTMTDFVEDSSILVEFNENLFEDILYAVRLKSNIKKEILEAQKTNAIKKIDNANMGLNINM